jgi:hypothetical protein
MVIPMFEETHPNCDLLFSFDTVIHKIIMHEVQTWWENIKKLGIQPLSIEMEYSKLN